MFFYDFRRITDLKGQRSTFPPLSNMESMKTMSVEFPMWFILLILWNYTFSNFNIVMQDTEEVPNLWRDPWIYWIYGKTKNFVSSSRYGSEDLLNFPRSLGKPPLIKNSWKIGCYMMLEGAYENGFDHPRDSHCTILLQSLSQPAIVNYYQ